MNPHEVVIAKWSARSAALAVRSEIGAITSVETSVLEQPRTLRNERLLERSRWDHDPGLSVESGDPRL